MSTITEVGTLFVDARATFAPIADVLADDDIVHLTKLLIRYP